MTELPQKKQQIIHQFFKINVIKLGQFQLKSGVTSPIYLDLRQLISYPALLRDCAELLWQNLREVSYDILCGIPYTALPIATCISLDHNIPMIMRRKEKKSYGTQQQIEGVFQAGQTCLILEDVITTASSVIETITDLEAAGLIVRDVGVLIDREQGGRENLQRNNYRVHAAFTLTEILTGLQQAKLLTAAEQTLVNDFIHEHLQ
jgi:orotate phosphoribosyltransferase